MPRISIFYGIVITMNYNDHNPPHFHARYGEHLAIFNFKPVALLAGTLPRRAKHGRAMGASASGGAFGELATGAGGQALEAHPGAGVGFKQMLKEVRSAKALDGFCLKLTFSDGEEKVVDLKSQLVGPIFEPLRDPEYFRRVYVEDGTVRWPNGADFDAEVLYYGGSPPWLRKGTGSRKGARARS